MDSQGGLDKIFFELARAIIVNNAYAGSPNPAAKTAQTTSYLLLQQFDKFNFPAVSGQQLDY